PGCRASRMTIASLTPSKRISRASSNSITSICRHTIKTGRGLPRDYLTGEYASRVPGMANGRPTLFGSPRGELFVRQAEMDQIEILPLREDHPALSPLAPESEALVQADRGFVETVDHDGDFLVAKFLEVITQDDRDRLGGVALAPVRGGDAD